MYIQMYVHTCSFLSPHPTSTAQAPSAGTTGHPDHPARTVIPLWPPGARCLSLAASLPTSLLTSHLDPRESPSQCHTNLLGLAPLQLPMSLSIDPLITRSIMSEQDSWKPAEKGSSQNCLSHFFKN